MKQKILIVLMALVLPVMISCGGDDNDETPGIPADGIEGNWTCTLYQVEGVDMLLDNDYYIHFGEDTYQTNMPCFQFPSNSYSYSYPILRIGSRMYCVSGIYNVITIVGETPDDKDFIADFEKL